MSYQKLHGWSTSRSMTASLQKFCAGSFPPNKLVWRLGRRMPSNILTAGCWLAAAAAAAQILQGQARQRWRLCCVGAADGCATAARAVRGQLGRREGTTWCAAKKLVYDDEGVWQLLISEMQFECLTCGCLWKSLDVPLHAYTSAVVRSSKNDTRYDQTRWWCRLHVKRRTSESTCTKDKYLVQKLNHQTSDFKAALSVLIVWPWFVHGSNLWWTITHVLQDPNLLTTSLLSNLFSGPASDGLVWDSSLEKCAMLRFWPGCGVTMSRYAWFSYAYSVLWKST